MLRVEPCVDLDIAVDVRVALVGVEAVELGLVDEVEDALDRASLRALDVGVEPLDEPPPPPPFDSAICVAWSA